MRLDVDQGDRVRRVRPDSAAAGARLRRGDILKTLNGINVASYGDVQYALHRAPKTGAISASWMRGDRTLTEKLQLKPAWRVIVRHDL